MLSATYFMDTSITNIEIPKCWKNTVVERSDEKIVTEVMKQIVVWDTQPNISTTCKFQIDIRKKDILNEDIPRKTYFEFKQK